MKTKQTVLLFFIILLSSRISFAQQSSVEKGLNAITKEAVQGQLEFLASDWTEGRETSTKGEFIAGDYIASMFKYIGLKPAGDVSYKQMRYTPGQNPPPQPQMVTSYFQTINFVESLESESQLELINKDGSAENKFIFNYGADFSFNGPSVGREFTAPLVFVGYGLKIDELGIDDFKGLDLKGKIIVCLSEFPASFRDPNSEIYKKLNMQDRGAFWKLYQARQEALRKTGAAGMITVPGYMSARATNYPFRYNSDIYEGEKRLTNNSLRLSLPEDSLSASTIELSVSAKLSNEILKGTGINPQEFAKNYVPGKKNQSKELKGKFIHFKSNTKTRTVAGRNVLGMIEGENPNEVIVIGAHYDHCGMYNGYIWNGADDNASGTVGVMTIAKAIIASGVKLKKTIIFAAWTGEEKGLFGSNYFVDKYKKKENLVLNLNFDMISRRPEKDSVGYKTGVDYTQAYPILKELIEKANTNYNLGLTIEFKPSKQPQAGTDFTPFAEKKIPIFGFDAAFTADYHGPFDHADKADLDLMTKIIKAGYLTVFEIASMDKKLEPVKE